MKLAFAAQLQSSLRRKRLSQIELANLLHSSRSRVAKMERNDPTVLVEDDLDKYVASRKRKKAAFALGYEHGYCDLKIGVMLKMAREQAGMTQEQVARKVHTKKAAISRCYA